jgi:hypothetical protein
VLGTDATSAAYIGQGTAVGNAGVANIYGVQNSGSLVLVGGGSISGTGAAAILNNAGGTVYDLGYTRIAGGTANSGTWIGSASAAGGKSVVGNFALTSGWGSSTVASAVGDSHRSKVSITGAVGSSGPILTWTFPKAYQVAPQSCTAVQVGGTFGVLNNPVVGTPTSTTVTFTFAGTPAANTYTFDLQCGP